MIGSKVRLFTGIELPGSLRDKLADQLKKFEYLPARLTKPENLHVTTAFIGSAPVGELSRIARTAGEVCKKHAPFALHARGFEIVYRKGDPVMIWIIFSPSEAFRELSYALHKALDIEMKREPLPHITLARIKKPKALPPDISESFSVIQETVPVSRISLFQSTLKTDGPEYRALARIKLRA